MSTETIRRMGAWVKEHPHIRTLAIDWCGGEPLLAFDAMCRLTDELRSTALVFEGAGLITNGYLLTHENISKLNALQITSIQITLDGPKETHDARRVLTGGGRTFDRILNNISDLMDSDYAGECIIRVNIDKHNYAAYLDLRSQLLDRFKSKRFSVYPAHIDSSASSSYDHECILSTKEWTSFIFEKYGKSQELPANAFYPGGNVDSICVATSYNGFVVGPEGELYKCLDDLGKPTMIIGSIHDHQLITNPRLRAQYYTGIDPYSDPKCLACVVLPLCGGGCANKRLRAGLFGQDVEFCSPYKTHLRECLEIYIENFHTRQLCEALLSPARGHAHTSPYRVISPQPKDQLRDCPKDSAE